MTNPKTKQEIKKKQEAGTAAPIPDTGMSEVEYWREKAARLQHELLLMDQKKHQKILISFDSGHYKEVRGLWKRDSVWGHYLKESGGEIHINKEKVEYIETF